MNIKLVREDLKLNKKQLEKVKIYLGKKDKTEEAIEMFGYFTISDFPLFSLKGQLQLVNKEGVAKKTQKEYKIKTGSFSVTPLVKFDESPVEPSYGNALESKELRAKREELKGTEEEKDLPTEFKPNSVSLNEFELKLFGEKVLSFPCSGFINEQEAACLTFNSHAIECYESQLAYDKAKDKNYSEYILNLVLNPLVAGWEWEDLVVFAEEMSKDYPEYPEFIEANFPASRYEARKVKLNPAAQAIFDRVQARKSGVSQLNAKQKATATQGQLDLAKDNLTKAKAKTETEEIPF
jgi:hypothetical protein